MSMPRPPSSDCSTWVSAFSHTCADPEAAQESTFSASFGCMPQRGRLTMHKFDALDGLRGVLALMVAVHHLPLLSHFYDVPNIRTAEVAVDFFFVLSGFVITHASLPTLTSWKAGGIFALRRFGRLWPLHVAVLLGFILNELLKLAVTNGANVSGKFAAFAPDSAQTLTSIPTNLLLIQGMGIHDRLTWNYPSWSISVEFYTYLLFAFIAISAGKRLLLPILIVAIVACGVFFLVAGPVDATYQFAFFRCVSGFFIGHVVYRLWEHTKGRPLIAPKVFEAACVILLLVFPCLPYFRHFTVLTPILLAIPIWVFAHQSGPVSAALASRPLQYLATLSYSIYITHALVLLFLKRGLYMYEKLGHVQFAYPFTSPEGVEYYLFKVGNAWVMDLLTIVYVAVVIIVAHVATKTIENQGRRYFNSLATKTPEVQRWFPSPVSTTAKSAASEPAAGSNADSPHRPPSASARRIFR